MWCAGCISSKMWKYPILSTGRSWFSPPGIAQCGVNWLLPYAEQLLSHGAVGLVINLGPYIEKVPPQLIVWCNSHAFPLLVLPWSVHIIDVTYDFCHRIIQSEKHERSIASAFSTWIFNPEKGESYTGILQRAGFPG